MPFQLYDDHGSLRTATEEADRLGLRSKLRSFNSGRKQGGGLLSRGQIHHIRVNPVYLGKIRHKDHLWPGRHPAIVEDVLWARVQQTLQKTAMRRPGAAAGSTPAPLAGKLKDETGDRLTPTHSVKSGRRHHYYISNRLVSGGTDPTGWRLPGPRLEAAICALIADHLERASRDHYVLAKPDLRAGGNLLTAPGPLVQALRRKDAAIMCALIFRGTITPQRIHLTLDREHLASQLGVAENEMASDLHILSAPVALRRRGVEARLVLGTPQLTPDPILLRTLLDAHRWAANLRDGAPLATIARNAGHHDPYIRTRGQLAFLSPKIQAAIRDGSLPSNVTLKRILAGPVPLDWDEQEKVYRV